jgi:hypothetical protein
LGALEELHDRFGERVAFFVVYIKEAHPEDGWVLTMNREEGIAVAEPATEGERADLARTCSVQLKIRMPVLLDGLDNEVARRYGGWPDRLYLIGRDGRVAYQGGEGPYGFLPEELESAIEAELGG